MPHPSKVRRDDSESLNYCFANSVFDLALFSVVSRRSVGLPSEVIHLEEDDQKRSGQASVPVLEVVPSATAPAMDAQPTDMMPSIETALIAAEPT